MAFDELNSSTMEIINLNPNKYFKLSEKYLSRNSKNIFKMDRDLHRRNRIHLSKPGNRERCIDENM